MKWPDAFYEIRRGVACPMCEEGRPQETEHGVRFYTGEVADAYLIRSDIQRGLTVVIWRGRHVVEPTELDPGDAERYWHDTLAVGRALEETFQPVKLNYNLLGNAVPHLHTHILPRCSEDPRPGWPFPFPEGEMPAIQADVLMGDVDTLRAAVEKQKTADPPPPRATDPKARK